MANSCACHPSATWRALLFELQMLGPKVSVLLSPVVIFTTYPPLSVGQSDPHECGVPAYELACTSRKATIRINTGKYFVTSINSTDQSFWVVDANLDVQSSCPLPRWDQLPYSTDASFGSYVRYNSESGFHEDDLVTATFSWACFVNCSQAVTDVSWYVPLACMTANNSFVYYVSTVPCDVLVS
ncbi:hypothetical protein U9M48_029996 [Paspalum notatum var. saurae]|uniref:Wall-associated receptor kinase galacturonan-binding domain-containing protein n=1 Tax=Paspalum notatum var. saurae TaxID=547442 RepID=A0AAQ3TZ58_PASNO